MSWKLPNYRYAIAALLFLATMVNYADRQMLAVVSPKVRQELAMTESDYGLIVSAFMAAYAIMYALSGALTDRLGTRKAFAWFVGVWSIAAMGHALARDKWGLAFWRILLGLGEPGNWPAAAKAVAEWFPVEQRALGVGIFNAGSSMGSAIAPPVVVFLTFNFGWRWAFVFVGSLGLVWLIAWLWLYQPPHKSTHITEEERRFLEGKVRPPEETEPVRGRRIDWWGTLRSRECYSLMAARFFTDPVMYFIIFWLPEYLQKERHFDMSMVGKYAWVPFIFGDIGYIFGGWLSGRLIRAGWAVPQARRVVLSSAALLTPAALFATRVSDAWMAIGITCIVTFAHALWTSNLQTLPTDFCPGSRVGTVSGLSGMGGGIGGVIANLGTGYLVQNFSYTPVFTIAGLMHPIGVLLVTLLLLRNPPPLAGTASREQAA